VDGACGKFAADSPDGSNVRPVFDQLHLQPGLGQQQIAQTCLVGHRDTLYHPGGDTLPVRQKQTYQQQRQQYRKSKQSAAYFKAALQTGYVPVLCCLAVR
jgi:hypothetical protein